jgi:hypothetical protein
MTAVEDKVWKPSRRQEDFASIPDSVFEGFYGGAAGGGKSELLLMLPIFRRFYEASRFKGILFRRTFPELEKSLILRSKSDGFYKGTGGEYNEQKRRWTWPSGAIMDFGYCEYEQDIRRYDTTEYNYVGWDELTSFTEFQYMYMTMSRVRTSDSNLPTIVRSGSNPGNIGHGWVRKRFVEPAPYGTIIRDKTTGLKRIFIQSLATDNPYLMEADPNYVRKLELLPEAEKRAKLYGDWWTFSGQVFDDWRIEPFHDEPPHARHVIPAFEIPAYWPRILATDWGYTAMAWNGWVAAAPTGRAYMYREYTCKQTKISEWGTTVLKLSAGEKLVDAVLDPSAWAKTGVEKTVAEQLQLTSGITYRRADNDRLGGKILMQEYLRWRPKPPKKVVETNFDPDLAQWIFRNKGTNAYEAYLDAFVPEVPETNLPKLQVFGTKPIEEFGVCPEFIKALPLCVYNSDEKGDPEDVAEFDGDDPYDGGRYAIKAVDRYYNIARQKFVEIDRREKVLTKFKENGDYNFLHRAMEKVEHAEKVGKRGVRRFHRAGRSF